MLLRCFILFGFVNPNAFGSLDSIFSQLEMNNCPERNSFRCRNGHCIQNKYRCNGKDDCLDGSDEIDCDQFLCQGSEFFKCKNGKCISYTFQCDGEDDCGDFSDELKCDNFKISVTNSANCGKGQWQCTDRLCIPEEWVCNGDSDCLDGSDETLGCSKDIPCDGFKCKNGHCIPNEWRCDGSNDCNDSSDETKCDSYLDPKKCHFEKELFLCSDNRTCLKFSQVCDGIAQCYDGSDEGFACNNSSNNCNTTKCSHGCTQFPSGPKCLCPKGYRSVNEYTCEDINECEEYGICDQKCQNTHGSYECYCDKLYSLREDNKTCKAVGGEAMMVFSSKREIRGYFLESQLYFSVAKRLKQVVGVGFDGHHIYWTDIFAGQESITRSLEDGSGRETLVSSGLGAPEDLAVDWVTGNIYFTDSEMQHIGVCSNNGASCTVLINNDIHKPRGIVLDPGNGEMYWSDWGKNPQIGKSCMDGSDSKVFISNNIEWPNGLTIDYPNERLYWTDAKHQTLESIRLDGTDRRVILKAVVKHPYAVAIFEDKLYWSDWTTHSIQFCDKFTGKNHHPLLKEKKDYIYGIHIFHSALKPRSDNPCSVSFCSHLCLLSGRGYTCACPQDKILSSDKHICIVSEKTQVLLVGGKNFLAKIEHRLLGKHEVTSLPTIAADIIAMCYSSNNGTLFISDGSSTSIIAMNLNSGDSKIIYHANSDNKITALEYDHAGNNLYWCDTAKGTVEILSLQTMAKKILMHDVAGEIPTSIALVADEGVMFIAFKKTGHSYHIDRFRMDGTGRTHVIEQGLLGPVFLYYEYGLNRVFWTDAGTGTIESTSVEGDDRHSFRTLTTNAISLASLSRDIFWTSEKSKTLTWTDKLNTKYDRKILLDVPNNVNDLYLVSGTSKRITPHPCHLNNGNCSHICLSHGHTYECACPLGMNLRPDNSTCVKPLECFVNQFFCKMSDMCIESTLICNGHKDCLLGEDEENCTEHNQCSYNEFQCSNGECIKIALVCDSHYDCGDQSDEASNICSNGKYRKKCPENNFQCNSGTCIADRFVCDGQNDCFEGEDEKDCTFYSCSTDQFRCTSGSCIPKTWECDKQFDCYDLSDEHAGCARNLCSADQFICKNGRCIDKIFKCDRTDDCGDMSDELDCFKHTSDESPCNLHEFQCISNKSICLPPQAVCNGTAECPHMEDEKDCSNCHVDEFQCINGKCLTREWICDGTDDCGDMSDEENDLCSLKNTTSSTIHSKSKITMSCVHGFRCKNGDCLDMSFVCNGQVDCIDGSDENGSCNSSCQINNNPCHQTCIKTPSGPTCACHSGYKLLGDGQTCIDVKECSLEPPLCSQSCTEMPGSYYCGCHDGYILRSDKKSCKSIGDRMSMIFVAHNQIRRLSQSNNTLTILYTDDTPEITGLDLSIRENMVYFSIKESGTIHRFNTKNFSREYMINAGAPQKLTVDWLTQNVYFVDESGYNNAVKVCNFDKKQYATLFNADPNSQISAITIDPIKKYLFYATTVWWAFNSPTSIIHRRSLDGMKVTEILKSTKSHITGLAVDTYTTKLYFVNQHEGKIGKTNYNGTSNFVIASNLSRPSGLNFFEDHLFFMTHGGFMGKCKLFGEENDRNCDTFRMSGYNGHLFVISQISRQPLADNICESANCTELCVPADAGAKCLCADGSVKFQGESCDSLARDASQNNDRRLNFIKHRDNLRNSVEQAPSSLIAGVVVTLLALLCAGMVYLYIRRRNTGKFNVSMKFYNPMFGKQQPEDSNNMDTGSHTILHPGEHEYANPVHINNQDMEAVANAILQKNVNPLLKIDE